MRTSLKMTEYKCPRCGYTSDRRSSMATHLSRKKMCKPILKDIDIKFVMDDIMSKNDIKFDTFECICKCEFHTINEYDSHKKDCKDIIIQELQSKLTQSNVVNGNVVNGNINITNNIIVLNGYNDTDVSKLSDRHFLKAINKMCLSVPTMIKDVHFNPMLPENQNIYISNMRNGYVMVFNKETKNWDARPKEEMIDKLINDREYDIQEWLGCEKYPKAMQKFNEYIEKKEEDGVQKMIKEEVELVLYNNRNMIKNK